MRWSPSTKGRGSVGEIIAGMSPSASMSLSGLSDFFISMRKPGGGLNAMSSLRSTSQVIERWSSP